MNADELSSRLPRSRKPSIGLVLGLGFGGLLLVALLSVGFISFQVARTNTLELLRGQARSVLGSLSRQLQAQIGGAQGTINDLAATLTAGSVDPADDRQIVQVMTGSLLALPQVRGLAYIRIDGSSVRVGRNGDTVAATTEPLPQGSYHGILLDRAREAKGSPDATLLWIADLNRPAVGLVAPVTRDGAMIGAVGAAVDIVALSRFVGRLSEQDGVTGFVLAGADEVIAHPALAGGLRGVSAQRPLPRISSLQDPVMSNLDLAAPTNYARLFANDGVTIRETSTGAGDFIVISEPFREFGVRDWTVGAYASEARASLPLQRLMGAAGLSLGIIAVAIIISWLIGRMIALPIQRLSAAALSLRGLDLAEGPQLRRSLLRELDDAARAFNAMLSGLRWFETYVPKPLVLRLMRRGSVVSVRRQVTVLFSDIVGFTSMVERLPAEEVAVLLNRHFSILAGCVESRGGVVDKYIGDALMAFWGAPDPQEDHAQRAACAALDIAKAVTAENGRRRDEGLPPIRIRIGLHSGDAIVGNIGAEGRLNYTLVGDTVNTAQRLENLGRRYLMSDEDVIILVSTQVAHLLDKQFVTEALGSQHLRGRTGDVAVFRLRGQTVVVEQPLPEGAPPDTA